MKNFKQNFVYRLNDDTLVLSVNTGNYYVSDCYPLNKNYQVKRGFEYPIPVSAEDIAEEIGNISTITE